MGKTDLIKIENIKIKILDKEIVLTPEQARELQKELNNFFSVPSYSGWWYTNGNTATPLNTLTCGVSDGTYVLDGTKCTPTVHITSE